MQLSERQWNALSRMFGGNSEFSDRVSSLTTPAGTTLKRLSDVQDSYLLIYNDSVEVEIHRYSELSKYHLSALHILWNLWVARNYPNYPI